MIKHFSSVQHRKTGVDIDCEQKFDQMPVWWMQRRGGHHCSQTHARLLQTAVSTRFHSCLNTHSQLFKWVLAPLKAQTHCSTSEPNLNTKSCKKSWQRAGQNLSDAWCDVYYFRHIKRGDQRASVLGISIGGGRHEARLLLWAGLAR